MVVIFMLLSYKSAEMMITKSLRFGHNKSLLAWLI